MKATARGHDPLRHHEEAEEREAEAQRQAVIAAQNSRRRLAWLLSDPHGRQIVRQQLADGGLSVNSDEVLDVFDRHHGEMTKKQRDQDKALRLVWPLLRAVADGDIGRETLRELMKATES